MKLPNRNRNWLREVTSAYEKALKAVERGEIKGSEIYLYGPKLAAKKRGIESEEIIERMVEYIREDVRYGESVDPGSSKRVTFHFFAGYIHWHAAAGLMSEIECDRVMDYINEEIDLFIDDEEDV